ncbi:MAG: hypothetical protein AABZ45_09330 [Pseudomonadota bacterium]
MGLAKYLEDITERFLEAQPCESVGGSNAQTAAPSREVIRRVIQPLLKSIQSALSKPEAQNLMRVESAEWDRRRAEGDLASAQATIADLNRQLDHDKGEHKRQLEIEAGRYNDLTIALDRVKADNERQRHSLDQKAAEARDCNRKYDAVHKKYENIKARLSEEKTANASLMVENGKLNLSLLAAQVDKRYSKD